MGHRCVVGVDLGGTNVRAATYSDSGELLSPIQYNLSDAQMGTESVVQALAGTIRQAIEQSSEPPSAVGIAVPGHIDSARGVVRWAPNFGKEIEGVFHHWENIPLVEMLAPHLDVPVFLGNDANLAALAEYRYGTGRNSASCLVMLTIGTGIGGGVVMAPQAVSGDARSPLLLVGGNQGGAELGHMVVQHGGLDCNAGSYGALEAYCQRDSIVQRAVHRLRRGRKSVIEDLVEGDWSKISPRILSVAAEEGDEVAIEVWAEVGVYLGVGIGSLINIFAPSVVAIGGQIAKAGAWLLQPARRTARNVAIPSLFQDCTILAAEQVEEAGMVGGAVLAFESLARGRA